MSRTTRRSRIEDGFRRNGTRDGSGYCCGRGKGCGVCGDATPRSTFVRTQVAIEKVAEVMAAL